ncbi:MAG: TetR/AcrR family transcriptional regulator [bacterium]|nr:TetR/AcrR family transcriptional regulator [bacterium]
MSKREATHGMILDRALAMASARGLGGLSIGGVAKEAGLSKSGLFAHFDSKEDLQLQVLECAVERFIQNVVAPALGRPRGEPRVRALFDHWMSWETSSSMPGGCPFIAAATELDDQPGRLRDYLVSAQRDWMEALATAARIGVEEGHFSDDLDGAQFAYELYSIILAFHHFHRLLRDPSSRERASQAFEDLIRQSRGDSPLPARSASAA